MFTEQSRKGAEDNEGSSADPQRNISCRMKVRVEFSREAAKALHSLCTSQRRLYDRVDAALERLAEEPLIGKPLKGRWLLL